MSGKLKKCCNIFYIDSAYNFIFIICDENMIFTWYYYYQRKDIISTHIVHLGIIYHTSYATRIVLLFLRDSFFLSKPGLSKQHKDEWLKLWEVWYSTYNVNHFQNHYCAQTHHVLYFFLNTYGCLVYCLCMQRTYYSRLCRRYNTLTLHNNTSNRRWPKPHRSSNIPNSPQPE